MPIYLHFHIRVHSIKSEANLYLGTSSSLKRKISEFKHTWRNTSENTKWDVLICVLVPFWGTKANLLFWRGISLIPYPLSKTCVLRETWDLTTHFLCASLCLSHHAKQPCKTMVLWVRQQRAGGISNKSYLFLNYVQLFLNYRGCVLPT